MSTFPTFLDYLPLPPNLRAHLIAPAMHLASAWATAAKGDFGEGITPARVAIRATVDGIEKIQAEAEGFLESAGLGGFYAMADAMLRHRAGQALPDETRRTMRSVATFAVALALELGARPEEIEHAVHEEDAPPA